MTYTYTFFVTIGAVTTEVHPLNFLESSLIDEKESGKPFYRKKFNGNLIFCNVNGTLDYDLLAAVADECAKIDFEVKQDGVSYWTGFFTIVDCKDDKDISVMEVKPLPDDDYNAVLENAKKEYNIIGQTTNVSVRAIQGGTDITYTRNQFLYDVIEYIANLIKPGVTVSSTFFTEATNPVTLSANQLLYLTIAQKSNIIRPEATQGATELMLSWDSLMNILYGMFQVMWNYDSATDTINVEHISWFNSTTAGLDLTSEPLAEAQNKYDHIKGSMPKYEKFKWMESFSPNFTGVDIWYDSSCVDQDPDSNYTEIALPVTTDLFYIISNKEEIADDGIVILCNYLSGGDYFVRIGVGKYAPSEVRLNMHLSWANLHDSYWRHNRVLPTGYLNGSLVTFWTSRKTIQQELYAVVCTSESFDPNDEITTELGTTHLGGVKAKVGRAELSPDGLMKFRLEYGAADVEVTPITEPKSAVITEGAMPGAFAITMSEPSASDLHIIVSHEILDNLGVQDCTGGPETWTIPAGTKQASLTFTLCTSVVEGWCVNYAWNYLDLTGDGYSVSIIEEFSC